MWKYMKPHSFQNAFHIFVFPYIHPQYEQKVDVGAMIALSSIIQKNHPQTQIPGTRTFAMAYGTITRLTKTKLT